MMLLPVALVGCGVVLSQLFLDASCFSCCTKDPTVGHRYEVLEAFFHRHGNSSSGVNGLIPVDFVIVVVAAAVVVVVVAVSSSSSLFLFLLVLASCWWWRSCWWSSCGVIVVVVVVVVVVLPVALVGCGVVVSWCRIVVEC